MQRKGTQVREVVEAKSVGAALAKAKTIASEDEKVLRMRYGQSVPSAAPLGRHGEGNTELQDEMLLMEMELLRAYRAHQKQVAAQAVARPSRTKEKIVRALRKKH